MPVLHAHSVSKKYKLLRSKNQVTNMDDVCEFFDFVVFYVFLNFYVLFVLCVCVCVFLLCCFSFLNEFFIAALCE